MFHPYVTISAAQASEGDDLRHEMFFFFGRAKNLGICEAMMIVAVQGQEGCICGLHLEEPSNWDSLCVAL